MLIAYAHGNDAALAEVKSVSMESKAGKHSYMVTLRPNRHSDAGIGFSINGISPDQTAEKHARLILLNESWSTGERDLYYSLLGHGTVDKKSREAMLPTLWPQYKGKPTEFLQLARLQAVYALKVTNVVDHILELTLGPISKDGVQVRFSGKRKQRYSNHPATVIEIEGKCPLPSA